jgi:hypothetical protein
MKRLFLLLALLCFALTARAQQYGQNLSANLTAASGPLCNVANSCLWMRLPTNATSVTLTITGTWAGTVTVEAAGSGRWFILTTSTSNIASTYSVPGDTDFRVRMSAYTSGTVAANLVLTAGPAAAGVSSFGTPPRTGAVTAQSGDYNASQVTGAGIDKNAFLVTTACGGKSDCLQLADDDSTDNCGTPLTNFITAFNAYSGPGKPVLDFEDNGFSGKAFKFSTCNINILVSSVVLINATLDAGSSLANLFQVGPTGRSGYGTNFIDVQFRGNGTLTGGASLTTAGIQFEPWEGNGEVTGLHFQSFGAGNATSGNCTNYAMWFQTNAEEDIHDTWWYENLSPLDTVAGRCILYDVDMSTNGGNNTARIYGNHWASYPDLGQSCGSTAIDEGGSHSSIVDNSVFGFGIPIRLEAHHTGTTGDGGLMVYANALDTAGCTAKSVSAVIHLGGNGVSGLLSRASIVGNDAGSASYLIALAGDTSQTINGFTVSDNVADNSSTMAVAPTSLQCSGTSVPQFSYCRENGNVNMTLGGAQGSWWMPYSSLNLVNASAQTANLGATTIWTENSGSGQTAGWLVSCSVFLVSSGSGSTIPSCQVTFTNASGTTTEPITATTTSSTVGQSIGAVVRIVASPGSTVSISTTGYVSGSYTISASIEQAP